MKNNILLGLLFIFVFGYGFSIGFFKIFPFNQALSVKHYLEHTFGNFVTQTVEPAKQVNITNTSLKRLLIKKIQIPEYTGGGGGLATVDNTIYIVSNKGIITAFDLDRAEKIELEINDVPMNFGRFIQSGHPYRNNFRISWFRVNGFYAEKTGDESHQLFVSHNAYNSESDCITHNISRIEIQTINGTWSQNSGWNTIFTAEPCIDPVPDNWVSVVPYSGHISGGKIVEYNSDQLLISIGDYNYHGIDGVEEYAMDPSNPYGKFILMDKVTGSWSVYAMGNRNPSGLHIDDNGTVWSVENGPEGGDELNIIEQGQNYGWPRESYGLWYQHEYNLPGGYKRGTHEHYKKPVFSWLPAVAPSGLIKIKGAKFDHWNGDIIMSTMRDQSLHRLRLNNEDRIIYDERIPLGHRIRDIITLPNEMIALLTDDGYLILIDDGGPVFEEMGADISEKITQLNQFDKFVTPSTEEPLSGRELISSREIYEIYCATCHNLNRDHFIGPHLNDLYNRRVGSAEGFNYSSTLQSDSREWNPELLRTFLAEPESEFPDNRMQKINLTPVEVDSLVHFFEENY